MDDIIAKAEKLKGPWAFFGLSRCLWVWDSFNSRRYSDVRHRHRVQASPSRTSRACQGSRMLRVS